MSSTWSLDLPWVDRFYDFRAYAAYNPRFTYNLTSLMYIGEDYPVSLRYSKKYKTPPSEADVAEFIKDSKLCKKWHEAKDFLAGVKNGQEKA